jgi:hypothetical protein
MFKKKIAIASALATAASCVLTVSLVGAAPDGARWWSYVEFLASDKLEGRNTGSEGHRKAAEYVAAEFERDGFKPAGVEGYIQPVKFKTLQLDESRAALRWCAAASKSESPWARKP